MYATPRSSYRTAAARTLAKLPAGEGRPPLYLLEALERRRLLSAGMSLSADGILTIEGTDQNDGIIVYRDRANPDRLIVEGQTKSGPMLYYGGTAEIAEVRGIRILGLGGDDYLYVWNNRFNRPDHLNAASMEDAGKLNIPVTMLGGDGDDDMESDSNADDLLVGGRGRDHAYTMDGHDRFAVEYIENYRDAGLRTDAAGRQYWDWGGAFGWTGPEDTVYDDPWQVPNRTGIYFGSNAPVFPPDDAGGDGHHGDDSSAPVDAVVMAPPPVLSPFATHAPVPAAPYHDAADDSVLD